MAESCLLYYITDRTALAPDEPTRRRRVLEKISQAARAGVDYIQIREKDLSTRDLAMLAGEALRMLVLGQAESRASRTALLINSRADVALAAGAQGVHLRSDDISPQEIRKIWKKCGASAAGRGSPAEEPLIAVSCHSPEEVARAAACGASLAVFAPVFGKKEFPDAPGAGPELLRQATRAGIPVLALGGITLSNARSCVEAGAAGIAGIRLFQENEIANVVQHLRG